VVGGVPVENDRSEPFRTKLRIKTGASKASERNSAASSPEVPPRSRSLMQALQQAASQREAQPTTPTNIAPSHDDGPTPATTEVIKPAGPRGSKFFSESVPRPRRLAKSSRVGRLAAAKLRQLARLKEEAEGLQSLVSGEIEEATVEIIRREEGRRPGDRNSGRRT